MKLIVSPKDSVRSQVSSIQSAEDERSPEGKEETKSKGTTAFKDYKYGHPPSLFKPPTAKAHQSETILPIGKPITSITPNSDSPPVTFNASRRKSVQVQ
jgi:hypothetical protein